MRKMIIFVTLLALIGCTNNITGGDGTSKTRTLHSRESRGDRERNRERSGSSKEGTHSEGHSSASRAHTRTRGRTPQGW